MSLPVGQQRVLDGIAETLRLSEPRLAAMFAIFTRLTKNEPRPGREEVASPPRHEWLTACARLLRRPGKRGSPGWQRLAIISQLAIAFVVFGLLVGLGSRAAAGCGASQRPRADAVSVSRQPTCSAPGGSGALLAGK
jgi:hypothetical protein